MLEPVRLLDAKTPAPDLPLTGSDYQGRKKMKFQSPEREKQETAECLGSLTLMPVSLRCDKPS